jgi:hypothetical protein
VRLSPPTLRRAGVALVALALVAGCGSSSPGAAPDRLTPVAAVQAAATTTAEAGSSRFSFQTVTEIGGQTVDVAGTGAFDPGTRQGAATFTLPGGMGTLEQRFLGDDLYITAPGQSGFFRLSTSDVVGTPLEGTLSPTESLSALEAASDDVEEVGTEEVRGEQTTRYRGTLDAQRALEQAGGALRELAEQRLDTAALEPLPFEAWIDDEGRLRRFVLTVDIPGSEATGGGPVSSTTTLELYDFGADVSVDAPPADQVQDGGPLLDALRGSRG